MSFVATAPIASPVRRFVLQFFEHALGPGDSCARLALATHELLENAIKFCASGDTAVRVSVAPLGNDVLVTVHTRNRATTIDIDQVRQLVERLVTADPMATYVTLMSETATRPTGSGLGLARVRVEADMQLFCEVSGQDLTIRAQTRVPQLRGAA